MTSEQQNSEENEKQISVQENSTDDQMKTNFMSYCYSFLQEDEESHQCAQAVWNKYLQCVGDVTILSSFFDTLPFHVKTSVLPKYQNEIIQWYKNLFHIHSDALLCSVYYSETFQRVIRYALKPNQYKKAIIYIPTDFDPNLKIDLSTSFSNIKFEHVSNDISSEDMIDINELERLIKRDVNDGHSYPFMVIANIGSALLGHCDELSKIKKLCEEHDIWVHVIGDLVGSLALLPAVKDNVNISCDSLTIDIMKLFGVQNLPYMTYYVRTKKEQTNEDTSHLLNEFILHSPSVSFLTAWSITQRCSNENVLYHMKQSFDLTHLLITNLKQIQTLRILNDINSQENYTYQRICSGDTPTNTLPRPVVIFRFQADDMPEVENMDDFHGYIDLLNLWLFDKLSQKYLKMNLELLKSAHFQTTKSVDNNPNQPPAHAIRFAPLEHLLDTIEGNDIQSFTDDIQRYNEILLATMKARANLSSIISKYENLMPVPMLNWAGIGAVRYIPSNINPSELNETSTYEVNTIQVELARKLQTNDSAFSLGGGTDDHDSMFYLRLGMIRKREDLDILLQKISNAGQETETSLKYVEDMAEKIKAGIEKVQKDLQDENLQLLAQDGLLRQLPVISNVLSWWSPAPSSAPLATKGRSFDLNSGQVASTEDTYVYRMQVNKQSPHAPTHNDDETTNHSDSL